jgi:uncharacterized protein
MSVVLGAITGALFGAGLIVSGMSQPERVIGFLDVGGAWDPSLAFVMIGAIAVYAVVYRWVLQRRDDPWFDLAFELPTRRDIDLRLVAGAAIFGIGWGLAGLCPGPALVGALTSLHASVFVVAMVVGMRAVRRLRG